MRPYRDTMDIDHRYSFHLQKSFYKKSDKTANHSWVHYLCNP
jgi:hypothetical protein